MHFTIATSKLYILNKCQNSVKNDAACTMVAYDCGSILSPLRLQAKGLFPDFEGKGHTRIQDTS